MFSREKFKYYLYFIILLILKLVSEIRLKILFKKQMKTTKNKINKEIINTKLLIYSNDIIR